MAVVVVVPEMVNPAKLSVPELAIEPPDMVIVPPPEASKLLDPETVNVPDTEKLLEVVVVPENVIVEKLIVLEFVILPLPERVTEPPLASKVPELLILPPEIVVVALIYSVAPELTVTLPPIAEVALEM